MPGPSPNADLPPDVLDEVRLSAVRGVGPRMRQKLIDRFGSAGGALSAAAADLGAVSGVGPKLAGAIARAPDRESVGRMLADAAQYGVRVLTPADEEYPPGLREIHDPPPVLYCRGAIHAEDRRAVAIVGTRRATRYGLRCAATFAAELARAGVTVVSGLARGVDGAAHTAALDAGGRTLAALAGGLSRIYPPEHTRLADRVAERGALLAEAPPPMPPMAGAFPQRNRIISGLSLGVLVIEAAERSGALITVRHAAEQGRDAFALPGPIDSPQSRGCHRVIQEGAKLVTSVDDVLEEIDGFAPAAPVRAARPTPAAAPAASPPADPPPIDWDEPEATLLGCINDEPTSIDTLVGATQLPVERVLASLSRLEAGGAVTRVSGVLVRRA
ncbi:DNA-processing protein DprA [Botrimarina sp.]|uniref:DNA-processing protein DprA n=1 Tax=Botrimarina sp. TaxID=2795802 RepID=UPI0032EE6A30